MESTYVLLDHLAPAGAASPTLFTVSGKLADWEARPLECFEEWLSQKEISQDSAKIYLWMWGKFTDWCVAHGVEMGHVRGAHIEEFLNWAGLKKHHRYRYVRLIERVYQFLALSNPGLNNPGSQAARQKVGEGHNSPTTFLSQDQRDALIQWIGRDLAIAAVMLGGGVKVSEARMLSVSCMSIDFAWLDIVGRKVPGHKTCLLSFARDALQQWFDHRATKHLPGNWLFGLDPFPRTV